MYFVVEEVIVFSCTWLNYGFECDCFFCLNEDERESFAMIDLIDACVEISRGSFVGLIRMS